MIIISLTRYLLILGIFSISVFSFGQEADEEEGKLPVKSTFTAGTLIESQTIMSPYENGLEFNIQHRFASMQNGIDDLFGIYAATNTRLALTYGITDNISIGAGTTMNNKLQDLNWKIALLKQTRSGSVPISISYYGNTVISTLPDDFFPPKKTYRFIHRISYLTEIMLARKCNDIISLQLSPKFAYYNATDKLHKNINYGITFGGRAKLWESQTIIFEYDQPFTSGTDVKPNLGLGLEIGTATHAFQIFATNYQGIIGQQNLVYNNNDPFTKDFAKNFMFGFNISVKF